MLAAKPGRQRDLVLAMIVQRLLDPASKLATTRLWHSTTLAEELGVAEATEDDLYQAMDWLLERQGRIEKKLAARHLEEGALVLYDVSSSYYEGHRCPLAQYGHDRDGKTGLPIIVYGLMSDSVGRPIAVEVCAGNTGDPTTVVDQVNKLRERFQLARVVLVGDRGMLTQPQIEQIKAHPQLGWITALTSKAIRGLLAQGTVQLSLLDQQNLVEMQAPDYPGERLLVCYNRLMAEQRRRKQEELLAATEKKLSRIGRQVERRKKQPLVCSKCLPILYRPSTLPTCKAISVAARRAIRRYFGSCHDDSWCTRFTKVQGTSRVYPLAVGFRNRERPARPTRATVPQATQPAQRARKSARHSHKRSFRIPCRSRRP